MFHAKIIIYIIIIYSFHQKILKVSYWWDTSTWLSHKMYVGF